MQKDRLTKTRYSVDWPARIALPDKSVHSVAIRALSSEAIEIVFSHALPKGSPVSIELSTVYRGEPVRIRAKTRVINALIRSGGKADLDLEVFQLAREDAHVLNNLL